MTDRPVGSQYTSDEISTKVKTLNEASMTMSGYQNCMSHSRPDTGLARSSCSCMYCRLISKGAPSVNTTTVLRVYFVPVCYCALLTACNALDDECIRHPWCVDFRNLSTTQDKKAFTTPPWPWLHICLFVLLVHTRTLTVALTESCLLIAKKQHHFFLNDWPHRTTAKLS
jgi:hypothetical protein